ncbi:hypothetical protein [Clostridium sp. HBUAS56010]|uniref:hypothetical protein n=1 Tax=Clostridium sp. HBUAS56010 TaxID=2571127 RepID=UPI0011780E6F|nr:hypothetical protein [Clostridium sp. HBUAS56010]
MYSLAQETYTHNDVLNMLQSDRSINFRYELLDKNEIKIKDLENVKGNIRFDSSQEIMGTASFSIKEIGDMELKSVDLRIRPFMCLQAPTGWIEYPLGTYIMSSPERSKQGSKVVQQVDCYDYSTILKEDKITTRMFVATGTNYVSLVRSIITTAGIKKTNIETSILTVSKVLEFEIGTSKLDIINSLLTAINYEPLHFDNRGYAVSRRYIEPLNRRTEQEYQTNNRSVIKSGAKQSVDMYNVPNIFIRYTNDPDGAELKSQYINDSVASPISTINRGRNVVDIESVDDVADQTTLNDLVRRIAIEKSQTYDAVILPTALMPHHSYRDCVFVGESGLGVGNKYIEYAWEMNLVVGGTMTHTLKRVVKL